MNLLIINLIIFIFIISIRTNYSREVLISFLIRFIANVSISLTSILPQYRILLLLLFDIVDSEVYRLQKGEIKSLRTDSFYQFGDKILDLHSYFLIYDIIQTELDFQNWQKQLFLGCVIFRGIGVLLGVLNQNNSYFFYFPDFCREFALLYCLIDFENFGYNSTIILFIIVVVFKIYLEYQFHIKKVDFSIDTLLK